MKIKKSLLSVITAVLCILSMAMPVSAAGTSRITFNNVKNTNPDLYITKQVRNADDRYEMPDDRFSFVLKLDGNLAAEKEYRVFNEDGQEVFKYADGESTEDKSNKERFLTSRSGNFTLLGGQTARFEYVGEGVQYEVTESETKGWTQVTPAAGVSLKGTVAAEGSTATFVNEYQPSVPAAQTAQLKVVKNISFPAGYEMPEAASDAVFSYTVTVAGKAYAGQPYTVTDNTTGSTVSEGVTDADGGFTLPGNCTATFEEVTTEQDYEIRETPADGWRVAGSDTRRGAVKAPATTEYYTNVQASFLVSKSVRGEAPEGESFTFTLLNNRNNVWAGARYYLYNSGGALADQDLRQTGEDGKFTLEPGQAALFVGIPAGTAYHVREDAAAGYIQRVPVTADGYRDKVVTDSVEELTFVNEKEETKGLLTVTKKVDSENGDQPLTSDEFTFTLAKEAGDGTYAPVENAVYAVAEGSSESTYKTDAKGTFTLKANQTARFRDLEKGTYQVTETVAKDGEYTISENDAVKEGELGADGLNIEFVNQYRPIVLTDLKIQKTDADGNVLEGAKFGLSMSSQMTDPAYAAESDANGTIVFQDLKLGTYYLKELSAPDEYLVSDKVTEIELSRVNREDGFKLTVDGKEYGTDESGEIYFTQDSEDTQTVHLTIENKKKADITYEYGNGEHPDVDLPEPDSVEQGTTGFEPEDPEADEDYTFDGWFYDPEGTEPFDPEKPVDGDTTLYGKWTPQTVTVSYEWADPENVPSDAELPADQPVRKGQPYTAERMETKENWVFKGWFTDPECTVPFADGMELNGDITLYGKWERTDFVITAVDLTAYTGGDSIDGDSFPAPRYIVSAAEGVDITGYTFRTVDGQEFTVEETGKEILIPELHENYVYTAIDEGMEDDSLAGIYSIENSNGPVQAVDEEGNETAVSYAAGRLTVRHVSDHEVALNELESITTDVVSTDPEAPVKTPTAVIEEGSEIKTNGIESLGVVGTEDEPANIALLHDHLLGTREGDNSRQALLEGRAMELLGEGSRKEDYNFQMTYLDLVNTNDGNVWVSSSKGSTVYLPYPEGTDKDTDFLLVHYQGLHREYGIGKVPDVEVSVANSVLESVKFEKTDAGIRFFIPESGFSPFALVWAKSGDVPGGTDEIPDGTDETPGETPGKPLNPTIKPGETVKPAPQPAYTPTTNQEKAAVKTGDSTDIILWAVISAAALAVIAAGAVVYRRRRSGR